MFYLSTQKELCNSNPGQRNLKNTTSILTNVQRDGREGKKVKERHTGERKRKEEAREPKKEEKESVGDECVEYVNE